MGKTLKEKVKEYIAKCGYTWTYESIMIEYSRYKNGYYVSFTAKDVINKIIVPHLISIDE